MSDNNGILPLLLLEEPDDESVIMILMDHTSQDLPRSKKFDISSLTDDYCKIHFRFYKSDLLLLQRAFKIPTYLRINEMNIPGIEGLCILLKRFAYPNRLVDLMKFFPRTRCELSRIINELIKIIMGNFGVLLQKLKHPIVTPDALENFANCIRNAGAPYPMCFGFIDGTVRPICRPSRNQKEYYNGHKRTHAVKFQAVMLPNGIIVTMHGPINGRRHDAHILHNSKIMDELEDLFFSKNNEPYYLYGDPAYPLRKNLIVPFKGCNLNALQNICNKKMSSVRESVEWGFGNIIQNFAFLDYKKNLKLYLQPIGDYYKIGTILTNCHTCLYGSKVSDYFSCKPPILEEYLQTL